jgi:hypothetical protein
VAIEVAPFALLCRFAQDAQASRVGHEGRRTVGMIRRIGRRADACYRCFRASRTLNGLSCDSCART